MTAAAAGAAAATTTASCYSRSRLVGWGAEDGKLPLYFSTRASRTDNSLARRADEFLEMFLAIATSVFINGHGLFLYFSWFTSPYSP